MAKRKFEKLREFQEAGLTAPQAAALELPVSYLYESCATKRKIVGIIQATVKNPEFIVDWDEGELEFLKRLNYSGSYIRQPVLGPKLPPIYSQVTTKLVEGAYQLSSLGFLNAEGRGNSLVVSVGSLLTQDPVEVSSAVQDFLDEQCGIYGLATDFKVEQTT